MIIKLKIRKFLYFIVVICLVILTAILILTFAHKRESDIMDMNLEVTSSAFENDGTIPIEYTGRGKDISPPLEIKGIVSEGVMR